jgi:hypothetical protein
MQTQMKAVWEQCKAIKGQKDFALAVKDCPLSYVLFSARKRGTDKLLRADTNRNIELLVSFMGKLKHNDSNKVAHSAPCNKNAPESTPCQVSNLQE